MNGKILFESLEKTISADIYDNILYNEGKIYLMDNHRLALWCWLDKIKLNNTYNLFHIDAHPDMSKVGLDFLKNQQIKIENLTLKDYREFLQLDINIPLFRWDNYISFFREFYKENLNENNSISCTHKLGSSERLVNDITSVFLLKEMDDIFSEKRYVNDSKWILNLDLDYFYSSAPHKKLMFSTEYIRELATLVKKGVENNLIEVCTIALSPECCGSWKQSKEIYDIFNDVLKLKYEIDI